MTSQDADGPPSTLDRLPVGSRGTIAAVEGEGAVPQRLLEMGLTEGVTVEVVRVAPLGDPLELRVRGYLLSIRKSEARLVRLVEETS